MNKYQNSPRYITNLSREFRNNPTEAEAFIWEKIKRRQLDDYKFRRQHPIDRYIVDFYCHELKLIVEIDGEIHQDKKDYDDARNKYMRARGYNILRFTNDEVMNDIEMVLKNIRKTIKKIYLQKSPFGGFRGQKGYTLMEALIALALFLLIIVPFIGQMSTAIKFNKGKEMLTASFILEQETAIIQNNPEEIYTSKTRNIDGRNWTVKATTRGEVLKTIKLSVIKNGKSIDEVEFYVHAP